MQKSFSIACQRPDELAPNTAMVTLVADVTLAKHCRFRQGGRLQLETFSTNEAGPFASRVLHPVLHSRQHLMDRLAARDIEQFCSFSTAAADYLAARLPRTETIWINDYALAGVGAALRRLWRGRIGFYFHSPFASPGVMAALPHATRLRKMMLAYDAIGFQQKRHLEHFAAWACQSNLVRRTGPETLEFAGRRICLFSQPLGIDQVEQHALADTAPELVRVENGIRRFKSHKQIVGLDRDLLNGGLRERLAAMQSLLAANASLRERLTLLLLAPLPPSDAPDAARWSQLAGDVACFCGGIATFFWDPVRLIGNETDAASLAGVYRGSAVGLFTALSEGTSLEAKRFVASQDQQDPGVLVLSTTSGVADELEGALVVNPYDSAAMAACLREALNMPVEERRARHWQLMSCISVNDFAAWLRTLARVLPRSQPIIAAPEESEVVGSRSRVAHGMAKQGRVAARMPASTPLAPV